MILSVDTDKPGDIEMLKALVAALGGPSFTGPVAEAAPAVPLDPPPAQKRAAAKAAAKPTPVPEPEPEGDSEPTMDDAVKLATQVVADGHATVVKFTLKKLGVERVSKLSDEDLPKFITALTTDFDKTVAEATEAEQS